MRGAAAGRRWPERVPPRLGPLVELRTLLAIVGVALAAWAFAGLYDGVREGGRLDFDHRVLFMLREPGRPQDPLGPAWVESAVRDVTSLGGTPLVVFVTLAVAGYLALARKPGAAVLVLISILGAAVLGYPQDGPYDVQAARIRGQQRLRSPDIYGTGTVVREVYSLRSLVRPGNSGGPLLAPDGSVYGVIFAAALDDPQTGFALTADEVVADARQASRAVTPVDTGGCD